MDRAATDMDTAENPTEPPRKAADGSTDALRLVLLIDATGRPSEPLAQQLAAFGYWLDTVNRKADLAEILRRRTPSHILIRIDSSVLGAKAVATVAALMGEPWMPPVILISADISMQTRLAAVRGGIKTFLAEPVNMLSLIDRLEATCKDRRKPPYRVLIVDDDQSIAKYHSTVLTAAGMEVLSLYDPAEVLEQLSEFRPELILMDHFMPEIQGRELAQVIRQEPTYDSIPIVFLSNEDDQREQLRLLQIGGDDFLTKPINPEHLTMAVATRAERFRALRATMLRDSLTGLLNHTALKERLAADFGRAVRTRSPLSFVLIDLDRFKLVNDTYGHPVGDQVLKSLSHVLKQRLRTTDIVGRYGGEEFAVAMPDTPLDSAVRVMDEVRRAFGEMMHASDKGNFQVTLSCGIASVSEGDGDAASASQLTKLADEALYRAKQNGRDRVEVS